MSEARITEARRWAEEHLEVVSWLRELERLGLVNPERAVGLLVYGEEALQRADAKTFGCDGPVLWRKLPAALRRNPFAAFSPRVLWRLHELLAEASDVVIRAETSPADSRLVFSANVKNAGGRELGGTVARRLFNEARATKEPRSVDAARKELRAILRPLENPAPARVNDPKAEIAAHLEGERRRERPAKRTPRGAIEADERVAERYGMRSGENLRKYVASRKKNSGK
jgi:hypothetical protein